jgi:O-antigen ligase
VIRLTFLTLFLSVIIIYSWKDWYKSLCGLILLMAFTEHPDMPKTMLGIQGLNPWNIGLFFVLLSWVLNRGREKLSWDMPRHIKYLLLLYLGVVLVGFFRMMSNQMEVEELSTEALVSEYLINTVKWVIPGLLLYDGCRSRSRFMIGLASLLGLYFLLGVQVIRWMPPSMAISGQTLSERSRKIILNEIGYHRVNLSMMLAGASWAVFAFRPMLKKGRHLVFIVLIASLSLVYAQALTAGRAGYVTWGVVGLILCIIRWRKYLLFAPILVIAITLAIPGVVERMSRGFSPETRDTNPKIEEIYKSDPDEPDMYTILAGRNIAWPFIIDKIDESPFIGYGRLAMVRTGLKSFLWEKFGESFPHPHNAYLEMLLDNGWIGFLIVIPLYLIVLWHSISLFRDSRSPVFVAIGGVTSALVLALLVASMGSQTFYPREGSVGMWCAIGLMLRVYVERKRVSSLNRGISGQDFENVLWARPVRGKTKKLMYNRLQKN